MNEVGHLACLVKTVNLVISVYWVVNSDKTTTFKLAH